MKALEMEEEELERFLDDEEDGTLLPSAAPNGTAAANGSSARRGGGGVGRASNGGGGRASSKLSTFSVAKIVVALAVVAGIVSLTYTAEKEVTDDIVGREEDKNKSGHPPSPTASSGGGGGGGPRPSPAPAAAAEPAPTRPPVKRTPKPTREKVPNDFAYSKLSAFPPDLEAPHRDESEEAKAARAEKWGKWKFFDGDEDNRPAGDYCARYPNRDVPGMDFPDSAWQVDAVYVNHLIDAAERLVGRAKEAVYSEYGYGKPLPMEMLATRTKGFKWTVVDLDQASEQPPEAYRAGGNRGNGGWTSQRSQRGLARRLLHAVMTNDAFTVVVAGGPRAAGRGGHFHQSYAAQMHRVLRPVLARFGVKLVTRNLSSGGGPGAAALSALGFRDLVGDDVDLVVWDAGSAEDGGGDAGGEFLDLFLRQALLSGNSKVPVVWAGPGAAFDVLRDLHNAAGADLGGLGTGMDEVPATESDEQAKALPYAARYLKCAEPAAAAGLCAEDRPDRFCAKCWIARDDVAPKAAFDVDLAESPPRGPEENEDGGTMGWREHLLASRVLIMSVLDGLQTAVQVFSEGTMGGPPLEDEAWHVTDYYDNIRSKLKALDPEFGACAKLRDRNLPIRICHTAMKGRGLHTPRYNPAESSLLAVVRAAPDGYKPANTAKMAYDGPDVHNSCYDVPEDGVDTVPIVSGRRRLHHEESSFLSSAESHIAMKPSLSLEQSSNASARELDEIVPGKGWEVIREKPGTCDGQYESICGRERTDPCPLLGYHDSPGALAGNEYAGWLVLDLPDVSDGLILIAMDTGLKASDNPRTEGWSSVNNERRAADAAAVGPTGSSPETEKGARDLGDDLPDDLVFDWAINGAVTSWDKATLLEKRSQPLDKVELWTLLDDAGFGSKGKVELAIRLRGCGNRCTFGVSHVYWA